MNPDGEHGVCVLVFHDSFVMFLMFSSQDLNVLKFINWEAVIVDESQSSEISAHFSQITSLPTNKRLLVFSGPLVVSSFP